MKYKLISITGNAIFSANRIIKILTIPNWFDRVVLRKKSEEIEFIGVSRFWRRLPNLEDHGIFSGWNDMLYEMAQRHDLRQKLKDMGR